MNSSPTKDNNRVSETNQKQISAQLLEVLEMLALSFVLLFQILYAILEAIYLTIRPPPPKSVKGEIVLITGTGHGIGRELALKYASEGATVVGWDINAENNNRTIKEIADLGYTKAYGYVCDVSDRKDVLETAKKVQREVGDVTVLINNAGIMLSHPLEEHTPEEIERTFKINVFAHYWTIEAFLGPMKKNNHGHIVALSSCAGLSGLRNLVPYCASKAAVKANMEAINEELRRDPKCRIKLTTIFPYIVDTGLCKKPKIRFSNIMPMLTPDFVASEIMRAQRMDIPQMTLPSYLLGVYHFARMLPVKAAFYMQDFFDTGVESDV